MDNHLIVIAAIVTIVVITTISFFAGYRKGKRDAEKIWRPKQFVNVEHRFLED